MDALDTVKVVAADTVTVADAADLKLNPKTEEKKGTLDQEVERVKAELHLAIIVLFVGFAGVFIAVFLFFIQAYSERTATYEVLLEKVDMLQAQASLSTKP